MLTHRNMVSANRPKEPFTSNVVRMPSPIFVDCLKYRGENLDGTYATDGANSTGKFVGYNSSGNIGGTENVNTGAILGNLNGTIQTP